MAWVLALALFAQDDVKPRPSGGKGGPGGTQAAARITVKGVEREYRLVVPEGLSSPVPLLFAFHGLKDSKDFMSAYSQLDKLAAKEKFILVYPNGIDRRWQVLPERNGDIEFFDALYEELTSKYDIDLNRVYVTGMSMGAYFTNLLAIQRSDRIAAIAPHSGGLGVLRVGGVDAKRKFPVLIIHGTADRIVSVEEARRSRDAYKREGHEVELLEIEGLGHLWGAKDGVNERMWKFFLAHPMR